MPLPPAKHGTTNRWRTGCRCIPCRRAHNDDTQKRGRVAAETRFPARTRRTFLRLLKRGTAITEAAEQVGVTVQAVHARNRFDPTWQELLDAALLDGRDPEVPHGTASGYRYSGCRCPECRRAHHPQTVR